LILHIPERRRQAAEAIGYAREAFTIESMADEDKPSKVRTTEDLVEPRLLGFVIVLIMFPAPFS
jgi:hypothetical protein